MTAATGLRLRRLIIPLGSLFAAAALTGQPALGAPAPISHSLTGTSGNNGWFLSNVTIRWTVVPDDLVNTTGCPVAELITAEGTSTRQCTAEYTWGTVTSPVVTVRIDKTAPTAPVGTAARAPDSNGWYNRSVAVGFSATDAVSGIDVCTGGAYNGPDSAGASVAGTCTDRAGNSRSGSFGLAYDSSAPAATVAASRGQDAAGGWYNHTLTVTFAQAPGDLSGPGTCRAPVDYSGPDTATASVSGTCTDRAGNTSGPVALSFKYDDTPPQASASPSRAANASGWYNAPLTISFAQSPGDTSGSSGCSSAASYGGPDAASVSRSGTCTDGAGNASAPAAFAFKYDASPPGQPTATPARGPDVDGWYNRPISVGYSAADVGPSGIDTCSSPTYAAPDSATASVAGVCTDKAGNTSVARTFTFAFDGTAPQAVAAPSRSPNAAGWFNEPLTISFEQAPGDVSGSSGCSANASYGGPDAASVARSGTCVDGAGNTSAAATYDFKYDATAPATTAVPDRGGSWYRGPLTVTFHGTDLLSGVSSCSAPASYGGPDTAGTTLSGSCADAAGNASSAGFTVKYDATAPSVSASPDRTPDGSGWFRQPFTVAFTGTDGGSGLEGCTEPARYSGPDRASGLVTGSCRDAAGNTAEATFGFRYDATAPTLRAAHARVERRVASIGWQRSDDVVAVEARRTPGRNGARSTVVYRGAGGGFVDDTLRPGVRYRYELSARDAAGNVAQAIVTATARLPLYRPAAGAVVRAPVRLAWERVAGARFYNVQLRRDGVKVLSAWPRTASLVLSRRWTYDGKQQELVPGRYTWWVWAARGTVARPQYGRPLGSSAFVVRR